MRPPDQWYLNYSRRINCIGSLEQPLRVRGSSNQYGSEPGYQKWEVLPPGNMILTHSGGCMKDFTGQ